MGVGCNVKGPQALSAPATDGSQKCLKSCASEFARLNIRIFR